MLVHCISVSDWASAKRIKNKGISLDMIQHLLRSTAPRSVADTLRSNARRHCTVLIRGSDSFTFTNRGVYLTTVLLDEETIFLPSHGATVLGGFGGATS